MATRKQATVVTNAASTTSLVTVLDNLTAAGASYGSAYQASVVALQDALKHGNTEKDEETYRVAFMTGFIAKVRGWTFEQADKWLRDPEIVKRSAPGQKPTPEVAAYNNGKVAWGRVRFGAGLAPKREGAARGAKAGKGDKPDTDVVSLEDTSLAIPQFKDGAEALIFVAKLGALMVRIESGNAKLTGDEWAAAREFFATVVRAATKAKEGKPVEMQQAA